MRHGYFPFRPFEWHADAALEKAHEFRAFAEAVRGGCVSDRRKLERARAWGRRIVTLCLTRDRDLLAAVHDMQTAIMNTESLSGRPLRRNEPSRRSPNPAAADRLRFDGDAARGRVNWK